LLLKIGLAAGPSYAEGLRAWIRDARKLNGDLPFSVRNEMVKTVKADLKAAGLRWTRT
jgi:hypothetical protein